MRETNPRDYKGFACSGLCCTKIEKFGVSIGSNIILEDVDLHIHCGELTAIVGPNGAGKSTLLKAILGDIKHTGKLNYLDEKGERTGNPLIGYVPQHLEFDSSSPVSVLDLFKASLYKGPALFKGGRKSKAQVLESLTAVNAQHLVDRRLGALSGGELQRILLALALDPIPDLLLLDEPVSGIDQKGMDLFYKTVSLLREKYDLSIILVSHDLDLVERYADRVILIDKTVLSVGSPGEVFSSPQAAKAFGVGRFGRTGCDQGEVE